MYCNLGLTGYPLKHSLSPIIHNFLLYSNKINGGYNCFELIDAKEIGELLKFLRKYHFYGLNITLPYKEEIINYVNDLSDEAKKVKSVNTLYIKNDYIKGYNTDLYGFKQMLTYNSISPYGKTVALIGAGGASRAVLSVLLEENVKEMLLLCRDVNKGYKLINDLNIAHLKNINVKEINYLKNSFECDIIINATSAGINSLFDIELNKIKVNYCAIDLQYNLNNFTHFLQSLSNQKVILIDGIDMLVYQALKSFEIWTERNINISIEEIKNLLKGINEIR
jgi:shikimate dehydrogenase